jgi:DNA helicase-2/ATP-dependent DNA helicase PcrA
VEVPFETVVAGILIRGRIDAIYRDGDGYIVVDWKTGSTELGESAAVQLAMYRLAWAKLSGTDISKVKAAFHYVPTGRDHSPANLMSQEELIALISRIDSDADR